MRWLNFLHFSLQTLLLDENLFDELPVYLSLVSSLRNVTFRDNIIGSPNQDILDLGWPGIKTYFLKQLENEPVKLSAEIRWGLMSLVSTLQTWNNFKIFLWRDQMRLKLEEKERFEIAIADLNQPVILLHIKGRVWWLMAFECFHSGLWLMTNV